MKLKKTANAGYNGLLSFTFEFRKNQPYHRAFMAWKYFASDGQLLGIWSGEVILFTKRLSL